MTRLLVDLCSQLIKLSLYRPHGLSMSFKSYTYLKDQSGIHMICTYIYKIPNSNHDHDHPHHHHHHHHDHPVLSCLFNKFQTCIWSWHLGWTVPFGLQHDNVIREFQERTWARNTDSCCMTWKISFMFSNSIYLKSNLHLWKKVWPCYHFFKYLLSTIRRLSHETHWDLCGSNHTGLMLNVEAWFFWLKGLGARTSQTRKLTPHKWDYKFDNVYIT